MSKYQKTTLKNGLRVVTEHHPESRSFSCGAWFIRGTRDEPEGLEGISHFLEHLVFKGTRKRSALDIAASLENLGGDLNAYTTKENTCYHGLVLSEDAPLALDVLVDLLTGMKIKSRDFDLEKNVILQEMAASVENHEDFAFELFFEKAYAGHPLAKKILGTEKSISSLSKKDVERYYSDFYRPENVIISASGALKHKAIVDLIDKLMRRASRWSNKKDKLKTQLSYGHREPPSWKVFREVVERKTEMVHVLLGIPVPSFKDKDRFDAFVLNAYLGGGMTSRLFQSVREKRGLVYNIQSTLNTHEDCGAILVYASTERGNVKEVVQIIVDELIRLKKKEVKKEFVEQFKKQIAGQILLGSDDMENRMTSLGVNEMVFGNYRSVEQVIRDVRSVNEKSMSKFVKTYLDFDKVSALLVGPNTSEFKSWWENVFKKN
jgi:predicted Zn-dependent peptidase